MITVVDESDKILESTYIRRAKQLVKKERAVWVDDERICLLDPAENIKEAIYNMESSYEKSNDNNGYKVADSMETGRFYDDENLFKLAKKKVNDKRSLMMHVFSYIAVNIFIISLMNALVSTGDLLYSESLVVRVSVMGGWGIGLVMHIVNYFTNASPEKIEKEYQKLKNQAGK